MELYYNQPVTIENIELLEILESLGNRWEREGNGFVITTENEIKKVSVVELLGKPDETRE